MPHDAEITLPLLSMSSCQRHTMMYRPRCQLQLFTPPCLFFAAAIDAEAATPPLRHVFPPA